MKDMLIIAAGFFVLNTLMNIIDLIASGPFATFLGIAFFIGVFWALGYAMVQVMRWANK